MFNGWVGTGSGAYSGMNNAFNVVINSPVTETAQWKVQHYVQVTSDRGNPVGQGWYNEDQLVTISVDSTTAVGAFQQVHDVDVLEIVGEAHRSYPPARCRNTW